MTIFEELMVRVLHGEPFHIDFEKRTMKVGKEFLIKDGEYDTKRFLFNRPNNPPIAAMGLILSTIETLYERYKYSLPSERSDSKRRTYFKALPIEYIPDEKLFEANTREFSKAKLEGFILCMILEGKFIWDEIAMGKWFWQSSNDEDLVILKKWIEKGE